MFLLLKSYIHYNKWQWLTEMSTCLRIRVRYFVFLNKNIFPTKGSSLCDTTWKPKLQCKSCCFTFNVLGINFQIKAANFLWSTGFMNYSFYLHWDMKTRRFYLKQENEKGIMVVLLLLMACLWYHFQHLEGVVNINKSFSQQLDFHQTP